MPTARRLFSPDGRLLALPALVVLVLAVACSEGPPPLERARQASDDGDRARAIGFYQQHLETQPDDFDARLEYTLLLGESWAVAGGDRNAILDNLDQLHVADPGNMRVRELFAMMLVREAQAALEGGRTDDAEALYLHAIDVHPDVGTASYHLGVLYAESGRPEEAFESWVVAALKRPPIPDLYLRLGRSYLGQGELDRAINTLELVAELRGTSTYLMPEAYCSLAQAHWLRGDEPSAREHLNLSSDECNVDGLARE
jgi:tetratricopeptide (TPR) repeat protein